jgi:hypothetical protein
VCVCVGVSVCVWVCVCVGVGVYVVTLVTSVILGHKKYILGMIQLMPKNVFLYLCSLKIVAYIS